MVVCDGGALMKSAAARDPSLTHRKVLHAVCFDHDGLSVLWQRRAGNATDVHELIRQRQEQMEHSSLTVKEEKAALQEMKRMKNDAAVRAVAAHNTSGRKKGCHA